MSEKLCSLYWVHLPEHTNFLTEGYIGITSRPIGQRYSQHVRDAENGSHYAFHSAIREHKEALVLTTLLKGSLTYCVEMERKIRPVQNLAWNTAVGGGGRCGPRVVSEDVKENLRICSELRWSDPDNRKRHSEIMKLKAIPPTALLEYSKTTKPWNRGSAVKDAWIIADKAFNVFTEKVLSAYKLGTTFKISTKSARNLIKHFKNGWNPSEDQDWLLWSSASKLN